MVSSPNVVWITIESTRADHTSLAGGRATTPTLDRIASTPAGRAFDPCITSGIWTLPSTASILTGTFPARHTVGPSREVLPTELETVPEMLGRAGYETACISPNAHLSEGTGLDRGFDRFAWVSRSTLLETVGVRALAKYLLRIRTHGPGLTLKAARHNADYMQTDLAKRWITSGLSEPFFLYLHLGGPHHPYYPPGPYLDAAAEAVGRDPTELLELAADHHDRIDERIATGELYDPDDWAALKALYDATIEYADALVGELFDAVQSRAPEDTVVVVTGDHGELFGEHGLLAHKLTVHDAVVRVPLVVHGLAELVDYAGEQVQHVDVVRTLLEHVGAASDQLQGVDLRADERTTAFVQRGGDRYRRNVEEFQRLNPAFDASRFHGGTLYAVRRPEFKYLRSEDRSELFALPNERDDVSAAFPEVARSMEARLEEWIESAGVPVTDAGRRGEFTDAMREQLSQLGYLED